MSENKTKITEENNMPVNSEEFSVAEKEAKESKGVYVHKFGKPFTYENKTYTELVFDWDKLCGEDYLSIESEMAVIGKFVVAPEFSGEFIVRMAAHACTSSVGSDFICALPLRDFNKIRGKARSFLMNTDA